jgi:hypothetical protein
MYTLEPLPAYFILRLLETNMYFALRYVSTVAVLLYILEDTVHLRRQTLRGNFGCGYCSFGRVFYSTSRQAEILILYIVICCSSTK